VGDVLLDATVPDRGTVGRIKDAINSRLPTDGTERVRLQMPPEPGAWQPDYRTTGLVVDADRTDGELADLVESVLGDFPDLDFERRTSLGGPPEFVIRPHYSSPTWQFVVTCSSWREGADKEFPPGVKLEGLTDLAQYSPSAGVAGPWNLTVGLRAADETAACELATTAVESAGGKVLEISATRRSP
jgi:hypothetical protein